MNDDDAAQYLMCLIARKAWSEYWLSKRGPRYDRFMRKLYIPTRPLRHRGSGTLLKMIHYHNRANVRYLKWAPLFMARKPWKIANTYSGGRYR